MCRHLTTLAVFGILIRSVAGYKYRRKLPQRTLHPTPHHIMACSLTSLPTELVLEISSHLDGSGINALLRVSRSLASIMTPILGRLGANAVDGVVFNRSVLHWAAANGHPALLRLVLRHGADVDCRDAIGSTPVHSAVLRRQLGTLSILLEAGADAERWDLQGWTPLHLAAITGNSDVVARLLAHGVDINARSRAMYRKTALHYAALLGQCDVFRLLVERGADLSVQDTTGMTAGVKAIYAGQMDIVQFVFGDDVERQVKLATVEGFRQFKVVGQEIGVIRKRIQMLLQSEIWAMNFRRGRLV